MSRDGIQAAIRIPENVPADFIVFAEFEVEIFKRFWWVRKVIIVAAGNERDDLTFAGFLRGGPAYDFQIRFYVFFVFTR